MEALKIRPSALAGTWYPDDPALLKVSIEMYLSRGLEGRLTAPKSNPSRLWGLILPHAGHKYSGLTCAAGVSLARSEAIETVVLIGPSHRAFVRGAALTTATHFETPLGRVPVDTSRVRRLAAAGVPFADDAHAREHCLEIILPFFQILLKNFAIVPVLIGSLSEEERMRMAERIRGISDDKTLLVASSDFVHYGRDFDYEPDVGSDVRLGVRKIDEGAVDRVLALDARGLLDYREATGATICGILPIAVLLDAAPKNACVEWVHYSQSADVTDDTHHMVSYAAMAVYES